MKTLRQLIAGKHKPIAAIEPDATVLHALEIMAENDVGALLVLDGERLAGVFSERDYARKVILQGKSSKELKVREIMTDKVFYVTPETSIEQCMAIMTDKHIRHLPILENGEKVLGIISIGDVVKETISQQQFIINQLESYITR
jgi:CBS domain-containing protein